MSPVCCVYIGADADEAGGGGCVQVQQRVLVVAGENDFLIPSNTEAPALSKRLRRARWVGPHCMHQLPVAATAYCCCCCCRCFHFQPVPASAVVAATTAALAAAVLWRLDHLLCTQCCLFLLNSLPSHSYALPSLLKCDPLEVIRRYTLGLMFP